MTMKMLNAAIDADELPTGAYGRWRVLPEPSEAEVDPWQVADKMQARLAEMELENLALRTALRDALENLGRGQLRDRVGSWTLDVARNELVCSDLCRSILGIYGKERLSYDAFLELVHSEDREAADIAWRDALCGRPLNLEFRVVAKGGGARRVGCRAVFQVDSARRVIGGFGVFQDLSGRGRARCVLHDNEELLRVFVDGAPVGIAMFDRDMRYIAVSRRYLDEYFSADAELIGRSHYQMFPDLPISWRQVHTRCLAGETLRCEEDPFYRPDGTVTWLRWEIRPWYANSGEIGGLILFTENITERKKAEEELRASKAEAERANNAKSRFLAAASHDLRQPLAALALYVDVLGGKLSSYDGPLVANMKDCVTGLSEMLNDLLDLSKLEAGAVTPEVRDFLIADVLNNVLAVHAPEAQAKGVRLGCRAGPHIAHTDPVLLRRMIGNLVSNAVRYTESGGVLVGCRHRYGKTWVEVWDTGIGFPPEKTSEIFEEFKQLGNEERSQDRGSGLGLAIVAKTAALLGLEIRVSSRPGKGSMFAVELPLGHAVPPVRHGEHAHRPLRIALVDDNAKVLDAFARLLQELGHQVVAAQDVVALISLLEMRAPDVIISDYRLSEDATGFDAVRTLRDRFGAELPALIITGDTDPTLLRRMRDHGIRVEHKPLDAESLQLAIAKVVAKATS